MNAIQWTTEHMLDVPQRPLWPEQRDEKSRTILPTAIRLEILRLLAEGASKTYISETVGVKYSTVKTIHDQQRMLDKGPSC